LQFLSQRIQLISVNECIKKSYIPQKLNYLSAVFISEFHSESQSEKSPPVYLQGYVGYNADNDRMGNYLSVKTIAPFSK